MSAERRLVVQAKEYKRRSWRQFGTSIIPKFLPGTDGYSYSDVNRNIKIFNDLGGVCIFVGIGLNQLFIEVSKTPNILSIDQLSALEIHTDFLEGIGNRVFCYPLEIGSYAAVSMLGVEYLSDSKHRKFRLDLVGTFGDESMKTHKG